MATLNIFENDAFSLASLTNTINKIPYVPGRIGELGIFPEQSVTTTHVEIEERTGVLRLIPTNPRGAPPFVQPRDRRKMRVLKIPQLSKYDRVYADQVQNIRSFGTESELETIQGLVDRLLTQMRREHDVTLERLRVSALQGVILDADGSTIYDLFDEFDVVQQTAAIQFSVGTTDIRQKLVDVKRLVEDEMGGTPVTRFRAITSPEFFDALVAHATVQETFRYQQGQVLGQDLRDTFIYAGIVFEEYRGTVDGTRFVPASVAFVYPEAIGAGVTFFAPGDFNDTVNSPGLPIYARQAPDQFNRYIEILTQSNPLPVWMRPRAVVKLTMS